MLNIGQLLSMSVSESCLMNYRKKGTNYFSFYLWIFPDVRITMESKDIDVQKGTCGKI